MEYTGYSNLGINDALKDALKKANNSHYDRYEILETCGLHILKGDKHYYVTLKTICECS